MELHPKQIEAIEACCDVANRIVAVTGEAGTGKTTILKMAFQAAKEAGWNPVLCAPTGKAAKRIYEATGIEASTFHRLLEYNHPGDPDPKTGKPYGISAPRRHRGNPIDFDMVFADEYAMVPQELHSNLVAAIPNGGCLRVFGDNNQLAPIEENAKDKQEESPFLKLLNHPKFKAVILDQVYRQGADSGILLNANAILRGRYPTKNNQWDMKITDKPVDVLAEFLIENENAEVPLSFAEIENQIIVPQTKGWVGTVALNTMIQQLYQDKENANPYVVVPRKPWMIGEGGVTGEKGGKIKVYLHDKVICTDNLYELGVFNGETGKVIEVNTDTGEIVVDFGDREQAFPPVLMVQNRYGTMSEIDPRKSLSLAYAITTHKSQGSEFKRVIYILNKSNIWMINRRNFYTAITRAREKVFVIADQRGLSSGVYKKD